MSTASPPDEKGKDPDCPRTAREDIMRTYWERLRCSADKDPNLALKDINTIAVYYDSAEDEIRCHIIRHARKIHTFLSTHASFAEVQKTLHVPDTIDHISCVNVIKHSAYCIDHLTIEEFYPDGPSMLEQDLEERQHHTEGPSTTRP
jgi:hypothetical protein